MFNIVKYKELNSTNKFALENIDNLEANTIIQAEIQTAGRGRFNRQWISDQENNCYVSFVLKPALEYKKNFPNLTQYLSIILCRKLIEYGLNPSIKWPNDVLVNDKKIAGILSEVAFEKSMFKGIILGIGVNLNLNKETIRQISIPATSLNIELNEDISSEIFIHDLADNFFKDYETILSKGFKAFRSEYISLCNFIGKEITIKNPKPTTIGTAINICENGILEILSEDGSIQKILSGDIIL